MKEPTKNIDRANLFDQCSKAEIGTPPRNLHETLHPLLLKKYSPLLDNVHLKRFKGDEFHPRRGELYLAALISEFNEVTIDKCDDGGPDFIVHLKNGVSFYLESIVPTDNNRPQNEKTLLKSIERSIQKKKDQYKKWISTKKISGNVAYILSIGLYGFDNIIIGDWNIIIKKIQQILNDPRHNFISAILINKDCDQITMTHGKPLLFNDLRLIHNPMAQIKIPLYSLNVYQEYKEAKLIKENKELCVSLEENDGKIISRHIGYWRDEIYGKKDDA